MASRPQGSTHTRNSPPLCLVCIVEQAIGVSEHLGGELWRQVLHWQTIVCVGAEDLWRLVHERRMRHGGHLEATHMVIHGDVEAQKFPLSAKDWKGRGCGWDWDGDWAPGFAALVKGQEGWVVLS